MRTGKFSQKTITILYKRAGEQCSLCPKITSKPHSDPEKFHNLGEAAHIHGLKDGPHLRYDPNLTPTELSNIRNGIWLCQECHHIIDNDSKKYTADALRKMKQDHENRIDGKHDQRAVVVPFNAPQLHVVANYVPRKDLLENVKQLLLSPQESNVVSITTAAIQGAGGFGKTTLAIALCNDDDIIRFFKDGIIWVTLGQKKGEAIVAIKKIYDVLTGENISFIDLETAQHQLIQKIKNKRCLVVVDDVWDRSELEEVLKPLHDCKTLITTRFDNIIAIGKVRQVQVSKMENQEGLDLLMAPLKDKITQTAPFEQLAKTLRYYPLLLTLAGRFLYQRIAGGEPAEHAINYLEKKFAIQGLTAFDFNDAVKRDESVKICLEASITLLSPVDKTALLQLGIFPNNENIPNSIIEKLWGLNDFDTEERLLKFHNLGLIDLFFAGRYIKIHDVLLLYFKESLTDSIACHKKIYANLGDFASFDSPYAWKYYTSHLKEADEIDTIHSLLRNFSWLRLKLFATDINELLKDFEHVKLTNDLTTIASALQLSAHILVEDKMQLLPQIIDRLGDYKELSIKNLIADALEWQSGNENQWLQSIKPTLQTQGYLQRILKGHSSGVTGALIKDDKLFSWGFDNRLLIWDLNTGSVLHSLKAQYTFANKIIIDKNIVITWIDIRTLGVFDLISGKLIHKLNRHSKTINDFLLYQNKIISWSNDTTIILWDLTTGKVVNVLKGHIDIVRDVIVYDDKIVSWSDDKSVQIWDIKNGKNVYKITEHTVDFWQIVAYDSTLCSWEYGKEMRTWCKAFEKDLGAIKCPFGGTLIDHINEGILISSVQEDDNTIMILDIKSRKIVGTLQENTYRIKDKMIFNDKLISWCSNGKIRIWDLRLRKLLHTLIGHSGWVREVTIYENIVISSSDDHTLRVWAIDSGELLHMLEGHAAPVNGALVYQNKIISYSNDHTINIWNLDFTKKLPEPDKHFGEVEHIAICNKKIISSARDNTLCIWDSISGQLLHKFENSSTSTEFLIYKEKIIYSSSDGSIYIINRNSYKTEMTLKGHNDFIFGMIIHDDRLVSRTGDEICVWELSSGKKLNVINEHSNFLGGFLVYENTIISWIEDNPEIYIWDLDSGKLLVHITGDFEPIFGGLCYKDQLMGWSGDEELYVWELASGRMLTKMKGYDDSGLVGACLYQDKLIHWTYDKVIYIANLQKKGKTIILQDHSFNEPSDDILQVFFHNESMISWVDNECIIWDIKKWGARKKIKNQYDLSAVATCSEILYIGDSSGKLMLFETTHFTAIASYYIDAAISNIKVDTDTQRIIVGDNSGRVHFLQPRGFIV